ncbi:hypothetical protein [Amycolatopsis sp. cmx-11-12]|uniref:hypothetical protein n=1 Tax=Amycolatopsis sp. cmx-11-12 TaxID=2785795 RepID=UPI003918280E
MNFRNVLLALGAVTIALIGGVTAGQSSRSEAQGVTDAQTSLVENFAYPGADEIFTTYGVVLISGDGHIVFADCATPAEGNIGLMRVRTTESVGQNGLICFKVLGVTGQLKLKIPAVFEIRGDGLVSGAGHKAKAELTTDAGLRTVVDVNPSGNTPVGVGAGPGNQPTTLLQLDVVG